MPHPSQSIQTPDPAPGINAAALSRILSTYAGVAAQILKAKNFAERQGGMDKKTATAELSMELKSLSSVVAQAKAQIVRGQYPQILDASSVLPSDSKSYVGSNLISWDGGIDPLRLATWVVTWGGTPSDLSTLVDPSKLNETKAMLSIAQRFAARQVGPAQSQNPFGKSPAPTYILPTTKPSKHPAAPAQPVASNWWDHDAMTSGNQAAIAASNANAAIDIANAVASGQAATAAWQGGGMAYGTPINSDNTQAPASNIAPQIQPTSGSQYTPPPAPVYQMAGLGYEQPVMVQGLQRTDVKEAMRAAACGAIGAALGYAVGGKRSGVAIGAVFGFGGYYAMRKLLWASL